MSYIILSAVPDKKLAAIVIIIAFGVGLAGGLFAYFRILKNKNDKQE